MPGCVRDAGREVRIHQHVDLYRRIAQNGRAHQAQNIAQAGMREIDARPVLDAGAVQAGHLKQPLHCPADDHAPSHRHDQAHAHPTARRVSEAQAEGHRAEVEKGGGKRRDAELVQRIQNAHGLGRQRHQQQKRKHDARERNGQLELAGDARESRSQ